MNIIMLTNTYTPHVGGVARSVEAFSKAYRKRGHRVMVVAPRFPNMPEHEKDVVRIPAVQNFNASDFSVALPIPGLLSDILDSFQPDIVHAHHPYLLGMTALRIARYRNLPLVFTHQTRYEQYTHYVPGDSPTLKQFVGELATRYADLSDQVFAPSETIRDLLQERGVTKPIAVVPTGVKLNHFKRGDGARFRAQMNIPEDFFVIGHLGRLAPEKNLAFTAGLQWIADQPAERLLALKSSALETAEAFSMPNTADKALSHYQALIKSRKPHALSAEDNHWEQILDGIQAEWGILKGLSGAAVSAFR